MNKRLFLILLICLSVAYSKGQSSKIDTVAVSILDHMSATIGDMSSCSFSVKSNYDVNSEKLGLIKHSNESQVFLQGPDNLLIRTEGDKGSRSFYYNGKTLNYYSNDRNQYAEIESLPTIVSMIDTINKKYGIDFPAADFLYPTFVDDILADANRLVFLGMTKVGDKECFHIAGTSDDRTFQFWISDDAFYLPIKVVIIYTKKDKDPQYEAVLSDWKVNPSFPDALFVFRAPPGARKIKLIPVASK